MAFHIIVQIIFVNIVNPSVSEELHWLIHKETGQAPDDALCQRVLDIIDDVLQLM